MKFSIWIPAVIAGLLALLGSVYVVSEGQTAIVLNLGRVTRSDVGPGLHFKWPLVESARVFDRRLQVLDAEPERYLTSERKDVSVDFFAVGTIEDVRAFYRATGGDEQLAVERLAPIIKDSLRNEINARTLQQVVSGNRSEVIGPQLKAINAGAATMGIRIVDMRIKQIDLPTDSDVIRDVYRRMSAQRQQVASKLRAEGAEQAQTIRAQADRQQVVIVAEAERDAQKLRGEGDAEAAKIYSGGLWQRSGLLRVPPQPRGVPQGLRRRQQRDRARTQRSVPAVPRDDDDGTRPVDSRPVGGDCAWSQCCEGPAAYSLAPARREARFARRRCRIAAGPDLRMTNLASLIASGRPLPGRVSKAAAVHRPAAGSACRADAGSPTAAAHRRRGALGLLPLFVRG